MFPRLSKQSYGARLEVFTSLLAHNQAPECVAGEHRTSSAIATGVRNLFRGVAACFPSVFEVGFAQRFTRGSTFKSV